MTVIELTKSPHLDLADLMPRIEAGESVEIQRDGAVVARIEPARHVGLSASMFASRRAIQSPTYSGNSVVDFRQEERS